MSAFLCSKAHMMTSSNESIFRVTALCEGNPPVTGRFPSQRPVTRGLGVLIDLYLNKRLSKQARRRWFATPMRSLWRHCNDEYLSLFADMAFYVDHKCLALCTSMHFISHIPWNICFSTSIYIFVLCMLKPMDDQRCRNAIIKIIAAVLWFYTQIYTQWFYSFGVNYFFGYSYIKYVYLAVRWYSRYHQIRIYSISEELFPWLAFCCGLLRLGNLSLTFRITSSFSYAVGRSNHCPSTNGLTLNITGNCITWKI